MPTHLDTAVSQLAVDYSAFPMPISANVAVTLTVAALAVLAILAYSTAKNRPFDSKMALTGICAITLAFIVLVMGNDAVAHRETAETLARFELAHDCRAIASVSAAEQTQSTPATKPQPLNAREVHLVEGVCGPSVLNTMPRHASAADNEHASADRPEDSPFDGTQPPSGATQAATSGPTAHRPPITDR